MSKVSIIGLDIAKNVFHAHGADERGAMVFSRRLTRGKLLDFFAGQPLCTVALEACGGAHHWARQLQAMGHDVRLIPPAYVKPFVKRNKNDAIDAEAICEAAQRPDMRFVAVKTEEQQAAGLVFRTRDLVVRQRTQLINAIRGHLAEYGWVAPRGTAHMTMLADLLEDDDMAASLSEAARPMFKLMIDLLAELDKQISVEELLGCLLDAKPLTADEPHVGEFLNGADLGTLSDLAASGVVSYAKLAHAAKLHLPAEHATSRWLDDRKGF